VLEYVSMYVRDVCQYVCMLRMWHVSSVTAVAVRPLSCFVMAATGVIIGAASPQLCRVVVRIAPE
jgi:hypothetical protein